MVIPVAFFRELLAGGTYEGGGGGGTRQSLTGCSSIVVARRKDNMVLSTGLRVPFQQNAAVMTYSKCQGCSGSNNEYRIFSVQQGWKSSSCE